MIIETDEEHARALGLLEFLMEVNNVRAPDWIGVLSKAVEAYELIHFPIADPTPEEAAEFRREQGAPICAEKGHIPGDPGFCSRCREPLDP